MMNAYRFGFNGMEKSPEINDNHYTAKFWEYDARIGRRWNIDPIDKPWESSYAAFYNSPLKFVDPLGLDGEMKDGKWTGEAYDKDGNIVNAKGLTNDQMAQNGYSPLIGTGTTDGGSSNTGTMGNKTVTTPTNYWNSDNSVNWGLVDRNSSLSRTLMTDRSFPMENKKQLMNSHIYNRHTDFANHPATKMGLALMVAPFIVEEGIFLSLKYAGYRALGSGAFQIMTKRELDIVDVAGDAFFCPGASAILAGNLDFGFDSNLNLFARATGYNKTFNQGLYDTGMNWIFNSAKGKVGDKMGSYSETKQQVIFYKEIMPMNLNFIQNGVGQE